MDVIAELDEVRASIDLLEHPFYKRWSAGELAEPELAHYAGQYAHAVVALADATAKAAASAPPPMRRELEHHADEEAQHVGLWRDFATAAGAGIDGADAASPQTRACVEAWTAGQDLAEHLAVLYVIEAGQPEISKTKLDGLTKHYGFPCAAPSTEYFRVHETLDVQHSRHNAKLMREALAGKPDSNELRNRLTRRAETALRGNWTLLDGVEAESGASGELTGA